CPDGSALDHAARYDHSRCRIHDRLQEDCSKRTIDERLCLRRRRRREGTLKVIDSLVTEVISPSEARAARTSFDVAVWVLSDAIGQSDPKRRQLTRTPVAPG